MGGIKTWDMLQEYPDVFAALAPMGATVEVGHNVYFRPVEKEINRSMPVPVFYAGGEITPLPELPFQADKCCDRIRYVFDVNQVARPYDAQFDAQDSWPNPIWGIDGDRVEKIDDPSRGSVLTIHYFTSADGVERTALASISGQGHECREHTCEHAWRFMSRFSR
jgi:poly(3-hydroxybutyrate) depolymerase